MSLENQGGVRVDAPAFARSVLLRRRADNGISSRWVRRAAARRLDTLRISNRGLSIVPHHRGLVGVEPSRSVAQPRAIPKIPSQPQRSLGSCSGWFAPRGSTIQCSVGSLTADCPGAYTTDLQHKLLRTRNVDALRFYWHVASGSRGEQTPRTSSE